MKLVDTIRSYAYSFCNPPRLLRSGAESEHYVDLERLACWPIHRAKVAAQIRACLVAAGELDQEVEAVAGVAIGAIPWAVALSGEFDVPALICRPHPTPIIDPCAVVLVEDVVSTGTSAIAAVHALQKVGHRVLAVVAIIDREAGGGERIGAMDVPYLPLVRLSEITDPE